MVGLYSVLWGKYKEGGAINIQVTELEVKEGSTVENGKRMDVVAIIDEQDPERRSHPNACMAPSTND